MKKDFIVMQPLLVCPEGAGFVDWTPASKGRSLTFHETVGGVPAPVGVVHIIKKRDARKNGINDEGSNRVAGSVTTREDSHIWHEGRHRAELAEAVGLGLTHGSPGRLAA